MAVSRGNFNRPTQVSPVRVVATSNISGTYFNGPTNDGVLATLTTSSSTLTIDGVSVVQNDSVLLAGQTSASQNGVYFVSSAAGANVVLQRRDDMQSRGQFKPGFFVNVAAGTVSGGAIYGFVEPEAINIGTDSVVLTDVSAQLLPTLPTIANHIATYTNTSGGLGEDPATAISGGNIQAGLSGTAGSLISFPGTAASGSLALTAVNSSGNFAGVISNASLGQASTWTLADPGGATSNILQAPAALVSGNFVQASGTAGKVVDSGVIAANIQVNTVAVTLTQSQIQNMFATPVQIVAAPGAGKVILVINANLYTNFNTSAFASGGVAILQYANTIHGAGTNALSTTFPAAEITAAASQVYMLGGNVGNALTAITNTALFFSNQTGAFTGGNAASTCVVTVNYYVVTATV